MSNSVLMLNKLSLLCKGEHKHQHLLSGRAEAAAFYPLPLLKAILQGMHDQAHSTQAVAKLTDDSYDASLLMTAAPKTVADASAQSVATPVPSVLPVEGGGPVQYTTDCKTSTIQPWTSAPAKRFRMI